MYVNNNIIWFYLKMMKKQYIFLTMLIIIVYLLFVIWSYKYKEYKINSHIDEIILLNSAISNSIKDATSNIEYKNTISYKNKLLKQEQWLKSKWEKVVYLTSEKDYEKFTDPDFIKKYEKEIVKQENKENNIIEWMTNFQKWIYYIFKI